MIKINEHRSSKGKKYVSIVASLKRVICHKSFVLGTFLCLRIFLGEFDGNLSCISIELSWRQELRSFKHVLHLFHCWSFSDFTLEKLFILFHWFLFNLQQVNASLLCEVLWFLLLVILSRLNKLYVSKDTESWQFLNCGIKFRNIGICSGLYSLHHLWGVFLKDLWEANVLLDLSVFTSEISNWVHELTSQSVGAVQVSVVLLAQSCLVLWGNVLFLLELGFSVSEGAIVTELASLIKFPVSAHLSLEFFLDLWVRAGSVWYSGSLWLKLVLGWNVTHIVISLLLLVCFFSNNFFLLGAVRHESWSTLGRYLEITGIW